VFSKPKMFKFLKRDCVTIPVAEIISGKIQFFSKHQRFLIATESSKYLLIFVLYVCVILCEFGTAISKRYAYFCCLSIQGVSEIRVLILTGNRTRQKEQLFYLPFCRKTMFNSKKQLERFFTKIALRH
jgi:hypothetical protein